VGAVREPLRVVASEDASRLIDESGGRLFVWTQRQHCCHPVTLLKSSTEPPEGKTFRREPVSAPFELYVPEGLAHLPDELHVETGRFPRRVEAYWDGCAWVV
jgi:hypothetical protein